MSAVIVYAKSEVLGSAEFTVWDCDLLHPGKRIASCPTRGIANRIARLVALASGKRCVPLEKATPKRGKR